MFEQNLSLIIRFLCIRSKRIYTIMSKTNQSKIINPSKIKFIELLTFNRNLPHLDTCTAHMQLSCIGTSPIRDLFDTFAHVGHKSLMVN